MRWRILDAISEDERELLAAAARLRGCGRGAVVVREGEPAEVLGRCGVVSSGVGNGLTVVARSGLRVTARS